MHKLPVDFRDFDVRGEVPKCGYWKDNMPKVRDRAVFERYLSARILLRSKLPYTFSRAELTHIFNVVNTSAQQGDWGARSLLVNFYREGLGLLPENETLRPDASKAIEILLPAVIARQPWAVYDMGVAYEHGYGDLPFDKNLAWAYYRKAVELGSPDAQMVLSRAYLNISRFDAEEIMVNCAFRQEHGPAAYQLAIRAATFDRHVEQIKMFHEGVKFGNLGSAMTLHLFFMDGHWSSSRSVEIDALKELKLGQDTERSARYRTIYNALELNPDLRFPLLDKVLPLPPARLPKWDGPKDAMSPVVDGPATY